MIKLLWKHGEGQARMKPEFKGLDPVSQIDALNDWIDDLEAIRKEYKEKLAQDFKHPEMAKVVFKTLFGDKK